MALTDQDLDDMQTIIMPLLGKKFWEVSLGFGSFITFNAGNPIERKITKELRGEYFLWIYQCMWRLIRENKVVVGSEDPRCVLEKEVKRLEGLYLKQVSIDPITFDTQFMFNDEYILSTIPVMYTEDYEHWMLFNPNDKVLVAGPGITWSYIDEAKSESI